MTDITDNMRKYSSQVVDGIEAAPARAMLHAVGFTDADFKKPQIGIAGWWSMGHDHRHTVCTDGFTSGAGWQGHRSARGEGRHGVAV